MTLEENITVTINKLKSMSGKMLSFEKRLKKLEETEPMGIADLQNRIQKIEDGLATVEQDLHEGKLLPDTTITVGDFQPNAKFKKWYGEVFKEEEPIEDDLIALDRAEELANEAIDEEQHLQGILGIVKNEEEVSHEVKLEKLLEKLDEVVNDG